ncbi:Colicin V production protein [Roseimaritima multifibrata]|uniref:Colicin V production protein n=1 Tax=Roseimaritima multifibrata TaxID=1930274 RepID=A0A517MLM4_9BACT|nr:CvpA family protein [Roseimaritima multifibrata]QDS95805.1 Colicin V production protein [Roseimaritima multifibrata]
METYDILMLIVLAGTALYGAMKGFAWQVASIASIVLSYLVAVWYREPFSQSISAEPPWNRLLAMLILYVGTSLVIWVAFRMVSRSIDRMKLREFDRHIGALFGLAKGVLYCSVITLFAVTTLGASNRQKIAQSRSGYYISKVLAHSNGILPTEVQQVLSPYIEQFDEQIESGGTAPVDRPEMPWKTPSDVDSLWPGEGGEAPAIDPSKWLPADLLQQAQRERAMRR